MQQATHRQCGEDNKPPRIFAYEHFGLAPLSELVAVIILLLAGTTACGRQTEALNRIQAAGVLRVAIDPSFPPFEYVDSAGQIVGYDADLAGALANGLGVDVHFVTTGYDALYDALTVGRADIIVSALYPDPTRTGGFEFSTPYFDAGEVILVSEESPIASAEDLAGKSVACIFGTAGHMELLHLQKTLAPSPTIITVDDPITITTLLHTETVDAIVMDHVSAQFTSGNNPHTRILTPVLTSEPYVFAVKREDTKLLRALEETLLTLKAGGDLAQLEHTWIQDPAGYPGTTN